MNVQGLYAIADSAWNPCGSLEELVRRYVTGGARIVQLRMKNAAAAGATWDDDCFTAARAIMVLKRETPFTFIINDYVDVAAEVHADGVHVGAGDMPVDEVKRRIRPDMFVGYSSHALDEARAAEARGADYVAFGAIYPTPTKGAGHPVQGLEKLREVVAALHVPVVAIGGITRANIDEVKATGVASVAMISALCNAENIAEEVQWFENKFGQ